MIAFIEKGIDKVEKDKFLNDFILNTAIVKWVEIIGEASYKLTRDFKKENPQIPWQQIEGLRHVLVHDYYEIDDEQLWFVINNDIPELKTQIENLYNNFKNED